MARPRKTDTDQVRISKDLVKKARMVAVAREVSLPEYLSARLREIVEQDYQAEVIGPGSAERNSHPSAKPHRKPPSG